jgi:hypothetical protein
MEANFDNPKFVEFFTSVRRANLFAPIEYIKQLFIDSEKTNQDEIQTQIIESNQAPETNNNKPKNKKK